jgi:hypothetical protein
MLLGHLGTLLPRRQPIVEQVCERQWLRDDHVGVRTLDDHLVDLVDAPFPEELFARQDRLALAAEELVEGVQVLIEQLAGRTDRIPLVEVEDVADAVEDKGVDLRLAGLLRAFLGDSHQSALLPAR